MYPFTLLHFPSLPSCCISLLTHLLISAQIIIRTSTDDDDLFDSDEEEEISKRVLDDGEDGASGPPEGWTGSRGKAGKKVRLVAC